MIVTAFWLIDSQFEISPTKYFLCFFLLPVWTSCFTHLRRTRSSWGGERIVGAQSLCECEKQGEAIHNTKNLICSIDGEEPLWNTFPVTHPFVDDVTQCQSDVMLNYLWVCTHSKYGRRKDVRLSLLASKMPGTLFTWVHPYTWVEHLPGHFDLHRGLNTVRIPITLDTENYFQVQISQTFSLLYWRRLHRGRDGRKITWSNKSTEHVSLSVFVQTLSLVSFRWGLLHFIWRQRAATKS